MIEQLFHTADEHFSFTVNGVVITCERVNIPTYVAFHVTFSSQRQPITIVMAHGRDRPQFWTSIPEGRQAEAESVGQLIQHFLLNQK